MTTEADARLQAIDHIVLMMENRSFDQMLGYLSFAGLPEAEGLKPGSDRDVNEDTDGNRYPVRPCDSTEPFGEVLRPLSFAPCVENQEEFARFAAEMRERELPAGQP